MSYKGVTWVNIEKPTHDDISVLAQQYPFHGLNLEDCLSKTQLTKIDEHEDHLFIVLHFPTFSPNGVTLSSQLSIFLGKNYLVTAHQGDLEHLTKMFQACRNEEHQRQTLMGKGSDYLLYRIIDGLVDDLFPTLDRIMKNLDEIEDKVFDEKVEAIRVVTIRRREIADMRRIIFPMKRVVTEMAMKMQRFATSDLSAYFSDVNDHVGKVWEMLEECKETVEIYKDTDFMLSTERANKILAVLTIVFTLTIPATVAGTFYGMNINLPGGVQTGVWVFFGPYTTFLVIIIVSMIPAVVMFLFFRSRGWL